MLSVEDGSHRTGVAVSGAMHLALLAALVFGFARAPRFDDAPESIPVETITTTQLNEIMEGEKTAKPAPTPPKPAPPKPAPEKPPPAPTPPTPPEPPKPPPAPPEPPKPEPPPAEPPKRPEPPKPEPPPPEPPKRPEPPKPVAEEAPSPPTRPQKPEETPRPPERPRPPKPEPTRAVEKFKPDEIAKSLARDKEPPRPKPAFDSAAISKLIGPTKTADAAPSAPAQGLANHHAARMSVSLENALNEWFRDSYKNCWNLPPSNPAGENYVFDVRVVFKPDGSLAARPVMLNPPHDPEWSAHADSVMRAVMRCNPLHIPSQYTPFFDQWRSKVIHFDPSSAEG